MSFSCVIPDNSPVSTQGHFESCPNNCIGVDPNSVVVGGSAILAATAISGLGSSGGILGPVGLAGAVGLGGLGTAGAAGAAMMMMDGMDTMCPPGMCQVGNQADFEQIW